MRDYHFDHIHLRSSDPEATARFFETMFAAQVTRGVYPPGTLYPGQKRISFILGGQKILIAPTHPDDPTGPAPRFPYMVSSISASRSMTWMRRSPSCAAKARRSPLAR